MGVVSKMYFVTQQKVNCACCTYKHHGKINLRFAAAVLDYRKQLKTPKGCLLVASTYSGEVTKALLSTPSDSAVVVKRSAWG
jgi:hypothetical protein